MLGRGLQQMKQISERTFYRYLEEYRPPSYQGTKKRNSYQF